MSERTLDALLRQLLDAHSEIWFSEYHAPIQGRIHSYTAPSVVNPGPAVADVEPLVILRIAGREPVKAEILRSVPIIFPGGSIAGYTYPLTPGVDTVALIPQDADLDAYVASGTVGQLPKSARRFNLSDCVAIPNNLRKPSDPLPATAFSDVAAVLWGPHFIGGSDATKAAAIDQDSCNFIATFQTWLDGLATAAGYAPWTAGSHAKVTGSATMLKVK